MDLGEIVWLFLPFIFGGVLIYLYPEDWSSMLILALLVQLPWTLYNCGLGIEGNIPYYR